jgi:hypothetical protein
MKRLLIGLVVLGSLSALACEQKGFIKEITASGDYIHFRLDSGFNLKQDMNSSTVQVLFHASETSTEVCANGLLRNVGDKTWGRATEVSIKNF